jgi:hypothetical protein
VLTVVARGEIRVRDRKSGARRVNEAAAAGVDADVIDAMVQAEEHEIAGRKLGASPLQSKPAVSAPPNW